MDKTISVRQRDRAIASLCELAGDDDAEHGESYPDELWNACAEQVDLVLSAIGATVEERTDD